MIIRSAQFKCSSQKLSQCPSEGLPEFAFIGRSNVGKSSLINMLTGNARLAKVSGTPGKTRLINHFTINDQWWLVDLPGYGYAKASKKMRAEFGGLIDSYVRGRENLYCLFVLVDIRHEPQKIDLEFIEMLGENGIPLAIVFTKSDKLSAAQADRSVEVYKARMLQDWEELPPMFATSSERGTGRDEILDFIEKCLQEN